MAVTLLFCLFGLSFFADSNSENILILSGLPSPSHHSWLSTLTEALSARGHNITFLSTDLSKTPPPNVHYLYMNGVYEALYGGGNEGLLFEISKSNIFTEMFDYNSFCELSCEVEIKSDGVQALLKYPKEFQFEVVLYDFTCGPCLLGVLDHFNYPPVIAATAFSNPPFLQNVVGGHKYPAYVPHYRMEADIDMSFLERATNAAAYAFQHIMRTYVHTPKVQEIVEQALGKKLPIGLEELEARSVLAFVNSHPAIEYPEPLAPNVIEITGMHIREPKPLPKDLEEFIHSSKNGTILFSLGTNIRSEHLPKEKLDAILGAFKEMPEYNFLWKFESDALPKHPLKNVLIQKWMPQGDILPNPKVKAFITHSGLLSTQEASWYGLPVIGIPFIVDQHRNIHKAIQHGIGEKIVFQTMTKDILKETVLKVVGNKSYAEKAKIISQRFRDQKEKPLDRAVWWIEYVLRNPNPEHLKSPVVKMGFFKGNLYDVVLAVFVFALAVVWALWKVLVIVLTLFGGSSSSIDLFKNNSKKLN